jgi:1,4-alpha-glucan branching enzyme
MASTSKSSAKPPVAAKSKVIAKSKAATPKKPAATSKSATPRQTAPIKPATEFILFAPEAKEVLLAGDFCGWQGEDCRMRRFKDGSWKKSLKLQPGRYEYRFVVDGHWWTDPENPAREQNPFGQDNSVIEVP